MKATNHLNLHIYFIKWHIEESIFILNEGTSPHPLCDKCGMFVLQEALAVGHLDTAMCNMGAYQKRRCLATAANQKASGKKFRVRYYMPEKVEKFRYPLWLLSSDKQ